MENKLLNKDGLKYLWKKIKIYIDNMILDTLNISEANIGLLDAGQIIENEERS